MSDDRPSIRDISDTAWWTAVYRARESERSDALFRDPFARRLAGDRGRDISASAERQRKSEWSMAARTYLFDQLILEQVKQGADMVVNLAAGLDARPYRMALPASLRWVEVDLPELLAYKQSILDAERPVCALERVALDLANVNARRELFDRLGGEAVDPVIVTEGLLIYLSGEEVGLLARDLAAPPNFRRWILDVVSPGLLRLMRRNLGKQLTQAGAPLRFGPEEGPEFFKPYGWNPVDVRSLAKVGAQARRLPFLMRVLAMLPDSAGRRGSLPWSGVCLVERQGRS
jgi:methyltransferase (TIGR00027 family)